MTEEELLKLYNMEQYLFEVVKSNYENNHYLTAYEFFCIIIWKANRAKSNIAKKLLMKFENDSSTEEIVKEIPSNFIGESNKTNNSLDEIVKELTKSIYNAHKTALQSPQIDDKSIMKILFDRGFALPMASAILTILYPDIFTIYDIRVCDQLNDFHKIKNKKFDNLWPGYCQFRNAVKELYPDYSLRDKDRILWAKSFDEQLHYDISNFFKIEKDFSNKKIKKNSIIQKEKYAKVWDQKGQSQIGFYPYKSWSPEMPINGTEIIIYFGNDHVKCKLSNSGGCFYTLKPSWASFQEKRWHDIFNKNNFNHGDIFNVRCENNTEFHLTKK